MSSDTRQRLRPWLQSKLDSGQVPGVQWKDRHAGIFQIPWKHGGKQDWSERDSLIFKEWAVHTGRYREGVDKEDWSTWKTRLRCALNKLPDIQEIKEESRLEEPNPYRVYRFLPLRQENASPRRGELAAEDISANLPNEDVFNSDIPQNLPATVAGQYLDSSGARSMSTGEDMVMEVDPTPIIPNPGGVNNHTLNHHHDVVVEPRQYPTDTLTGAPMGFSNMPNVGTTPTVSQGSHGPDQYQPQQSHIQSPVYTNEPSDHHMFVKMRYRHHEVQEYRVEKCAGCRLYYGPESEGSSWLGDTGIEIFGPRDVDQLKFPSYANLMETPQQAESTNKLLNVLDRGLVLENINGDIYATRLCRCVIFVHSAFLTKHQGTSLPFKLQRNIKREKIFDFQQHFLTELEKYRQGHAPRPSPDILIGFGQKWTPEVQDFRSLFISATVSHAKALYLLQQLPLPSPTTGSLQISSADAYDNYVDQVKEVQMTDLQNLH